MSTLVKTYGQYEVHMLETHEQINYGHAGYLYIVVNASNRRMSLGFYDNINYADNLAEGLDKRDQKVLTAEMDKVLRE